MEKTFKPRDTFPWQRESEDFYLLKLYPSKSRVSGGGPRGPSLGQPPERQICPAENALSEEPLDTPRPFQYKLRFESFIRNHANFNTKKYKCNKNLVLIKFPGFSQHCSHPIHEQTILGWLHHHGSSSPVTPED